MTSNGGIRRPAGSVVVAGIVAVAALATAAVMFATGDAALERLALLFAILSPTILALVAALRGDTAAARLDGTLDDRIMSNVERAMAARRAGDRPTEVPPVVKAGPLEGEH